MLLIFQIAAGIVLGFAIIAYRGAIFKSGKWLVSVAFVLVMLGLVVWGANEAVSAAKPYAGEFFAKIGMIIFMIPILAFGAAGGWGLWELLRIVLRREKKPRSDTFELTIFAFMSMLNAMIVALVTWPLLSYTIIGDWYDRIDQWSRANGHSDSGAIAVASLFWLWPYLPLVLIWRRRTRADGAHKDSDKLDTQLES